MVTIVNIGTLQCAHNGLKMKSTLIVRMGWNVGYVTGIPSIPVDLRIAEEKLAIKKSHQDRQRGEPLQLEPQQATVRMIMWKKRNEKEIAKRKRNFPNHPRVCNCVGNGGFPSG